MFTDIRFCLVFLRGVVAVRPRLLRLQGLLLRWPPFPFPYLRIQLLNGNNNYVKQLIRRAQSSRESTGRKRAGVYTSHTKCLTVAKRGVAVHVTVDAAVIYISLRGSRPRELLVDLEMISNKKKQPLEKSNKRKKTNVTKTWSNDDAPVREMKPPRHYRCGAHTIWVFRHEADSAVGAIRARRTNQQPPLQSRDPSPFARGYTGRERGHAAKDRSASGLTSTKQHPPYCQLRAEQSIDSFLAPAALRDPKQPRPRGLCNTPLHSPPHTHTRTQNAELKINLRVASFPE